MPASFVQILGYTMIPAAAAALGGTVAAWRPPSPRVQSMLQHFAAGVVFAAVAGELLPELHHAASPVATVIGFALGVAVMLTVKALLGHEGAPEGSPEPGAVGPSKATRALVVAVAVDVFIDGLLVGVGFAAGTEQGVLITIALTLEVLFLGMSTATTIRRAGASRQRVMAISGVIALLLVVGATVGGSLLSLLTGGVLVGVIAFGAAALLYLVTEELLTEAHEVPETPLTTAMFFVGFLALLLLEMAA